MTTRRIALAALFLSLATLFCTLKPSGAPGGSSGPISDDERIETLDKISEVMEGSMLPDGEVDKPALLEYFESNAQFELSGEAPDGSVWARFTDGRLVIIPPPIPEASEEQATPAPSSDSTSPALSYAPPAVAVPVAAHDAQEGKAVSRMRQQGGEEYNLPASDDAIVMTALGVVFADAAPDVNKWLNEKGYSSRIVDPTVENLKTVQNAGVFYIATHGGQGCLGTFEECKAERTPVAPAAPAAAPPQVAHTYALWTSTPVSKANDAAYKADLDGQFLAYMRANSGIDETKKTLEWRYAITGEFVGTYMKFSDDSLAFIDACSSSNPDLEQGLRKANISVFFGWSAPVAPLDRPNYFFDRMLGINGAYEGFEKPEPPNRPFDLASVMKMMDAAGSSSVVSSKGSVAKLDGWRVRGSFMILRPTIERLVVHEDDNELEILGMFGSEEGKVTIDAKDVLVKEWKSEKIRVSLPGADEWGGSGDVVVEVRDHESNTVPLTLWHVKFTYTEGPEQTINAYQRLYLDIYWRADVHRYRDYPDNSDFHDPEPVALEPADGSSGNWDCDWSGSYLGISFTTEIGSGELPFTREAGAIGFTSAAKIDPKEHTISHLEFGLNFDDENTCVVKSEGYGYSTTQASGFVDLPSLLDEYNPAAPVTEPLKLDDEWTLTGANRSLNHDGKWPWLKWEDTEPEYAPDPKKTDA